MGKYVALLYALFVIAHTNANDDNTRKRKKLFDEIFNTIQAIRDGKNPPTLEEGIVALSMLDSFDENAIPAQEKPSTLETYLSSDSPFTTHKKVTGIFKKACSFKKDNPYIKSKL